MKRKLISLMLCGILAFTLVSCGDDDKKDTNKDSSNATTTEVADSNTTEEDTENNKGESTESDKSEYKTLTTDEAIAFNEKTVSKMKDYLEGKGFKISYLDYDDDLVEGPVSADASGTGAYNEYNYIGYSAEIKDKITAVKYEFAYYADRKGIQAGTVEIPKARDLLIAEPYKIMTGDEISEELLDKIDEVIEEGFIEDDQDETTVEINGPFKVTVRVDGIDLTFQIISDGDGKGN